MDFLRSHALRWFVRFFILSLTAALLWVPCQAQTEAHPSHSCPAAGAVDPGPSSTLHRELRVDLAAAFRMVARLGMDEGVANHFSCTVAPNSSQFLVNPFGRHFSNMRASDLLLLDANQRTPDLQKADPTAWAIHGAIHRNNPQARCILHVHSKYATVVASIEPHSADTSTPLPPIDQNSMRFFRRVAFDDGFDGMGLDDEAERLSLQLGSRRVLLLGNHGVITVGENVARAYDELFYFERAAQTYVLALSTGKKLRVVSDAVAAKTASQWDDYMDTLGQADAHLREIHTILQREEPDYLL